MCSEKFKPADLSTELSLNWTIFVVQNLIYKLGLYENFLIEFSEPDNFYNSFQNIKVENVFSLHLLGLSGEFSHGLGGS